MPNDNSGFNEVVQIYIDLQKATEDLKSLGGLFDGQLLSIRNAAARAAQDIQKEFIAGFEIRDQAGKFLSVVNQTFKAIKDEQKDLVESFDKIDQQVLKSRLAREEEAMAIRKAMYKDEEQYRLDQAEIVHNRIMALKRQEAEAQANQPSAAPGLSSIFGSPNGLRAGAGVAGALGHYQIGAALYGASHVQQMAETAGGVDELGAAFLRVTPIALAAGAAIAGVGIALHAEDFDTEVAQVGALLGDAGGKGEVFARSLDDIAEAAKNISANFNIDIKEVLGGFREALSTGIGKNELEDFSKQAATLSKAIGVDFTDATHILTAFKTDYGASIGDLAHINDVLFTVVRTGGVDVKELTSNFGRLLGIAREAGVSMEDMAAGVSVLSRSGFTTSQAITSLMTIIEKTIAPSGAAKEKLEELGLAGEKAFGANGFLGFIDKLKQATGGQLDMVSSLFPDRFSKRGIEALIQADDALHSVSKSAQETGTATNAAADAMDTFQVNIEKVHKAISGELLVAGRDMLKLLSDMIIGKGPISEESLKAWERLVVNLASIAKYMLIIASVPVRAAQAILGGVEVTAGSVASAATLGKHGGDLIDRGAGNIHDAFAKPVEEFHDAAQQQIKELNDINSATQDLGKTIEDNINAKMKEAFSGAKSSIDDTADSVDKLDKKLTKINDSEFSIHARAGQQEKKKDLEDTIAKYEIAIKEQEDALAASKDANMTSSQQLDAVGLLSNDELSTLNKQGFIPGQSTPFDTSSQAIQDMKARLQDYKAGLQLLEQQVMGQMTDQEFKEAVKHVNEWTKEVEQRTKDREAARKLEADQQKQFDKEVVDASIAEYKREEDAYKKAQDEKLKKEEEIQKKILTLNEKTQDIVDRLIEHKNSLALSAAQGDPGRQRHLAQDQFQEANDRLEAFKNSGSGSIEEFKELVAAVSKAGDAIAGAEKSLYGESVAAKHRSAIDDTLIADVGQFQSTAGADLQSQYDTVDNQRFNKPSYASAAAIAAQKVGDKKNIEQRVINTTANIKLNIDGTVSPETLKAIADATRTELEKTLNQGTDRSNYDPASYGNNYYDPATDPRAGGATVGNGSEGDIYGN